MKAGKYGGTRPACPSCGGRHTIAAHEWMLSVGMKPGAQANTYDEETGMGHWQPEVAPEEAKVNVVPWKSSGKEKS